MNRPSFCPNEAQLRRYALGQAAEDEAVRLEQHLAECAACLRTLQVLHDRDGLCEALRQGTAAWPHDLLLEQLEERLRGLWQADRRCPGPDGAETPRSGGSGDTLSPEKATADLSHVCDFLGPPQAADEIGRLGPYGILRVLGQGGMGIVFAARQARPRRLVALKVVLAGRHARERLARFRGEAELVARLQHSGIVPIHEVGEHDGRAWYAMELVSGGNLAHRLAAAPLPPRAAGRLTEELARAVQHAHERGVIHRDLKPANVLLAADGTPRIADFGLAKQLEGESVGAMGPPTESGAILGTPGYMAPEQAAGNSQGVGPAADVYALGAILYECLTGRPPFKAATVLETLEQVRSREPLPPGRLQPGLPRDLQTICLKCLRKEPTRRYLSARELADDLGRFLRGEPIHARPATRAERLWKWAWRQPALAALVVVSSLSLAVLVAGGLVHDARLRAAVRRAEVKEEEARRQQALVASNFRAARTTLDRMLERVESPPGGTVPQSEELRRDLLEEVLGFYREAHGADDPDAVVRGDTAWALARAGAIQLSLGRNEPAAADLQRAVELLEGLPPEQRSPPLWQDRLAGCYIQLGMLAGHVGRREEMENCYQRALGIHERLAEAYPEEPVWQFGLANAELRLGSVCRETSRWTEAESHYCRARDIHTRLLAAHPRDNSIRVGLATDNVSLGHLHRLMGRPAAARASFAKAEELFAPLGEAHPDDIEYALHAGPLYFTWADFLQEQGQPEAAWRHASQAVDLAEGVLRLKPHMAIARAHARESHQKRAIACQSLGRWDDAVRDWDRVVELDEQPRPWERRVQRAVALDRAGAPARAATEALALAEDPEINPDGLWNLARVWARSAHAAGSDARLPAPERAALADRHAERAIALLRKLQAEGYFKDVGHAAALRTEADLQPLRDRADFQKLLTAKE
jgi:tetratricopeptide (TPR) repeat protein